MSNDWEYWRVMELDKRAANDKSPAIGHEGTEDHMVEIDSVEQRISGEEERIYEDGNKRKTPKQNGKRGVMGDGSTENNGDRFWLNTGQDARQIAYTDVWGAKIRHFCRILSQKVNCHHISFTFGQQTRYTTCVLKYVKLRIADPHALRCQTIRLYWPWSTKMVNYVDVLKDIKFPVLYVHGFFSTLFYWS